MPPRRPTRRTRVVATRRRSVTTQRNDEPGLGTIDAVTNLDEGVAAHAGDDDKEVAEDDLCPICRLLLFEPVTTDCGHNLCRSCMIHWADVSISAPMTIVNVNERPQDFNAATGLEARCPMCRTQTQATLNSDRAAALEAKYSAAYEERRQDESQDDDRESIQTLTVYVGNSHENIEPASEESHNSHRWTFFVRPSRTDIVEEVQFFLHPTFRPSRIIRQRPPYEISRIGWGYFTIVAGVILKPGYSWVSSDAEDSPDGAPNGMLRVEWTLDFSSFGGTGAKGRCRLKVKNDRAWQDVSDEEQRDQAEWSRVVRQYQRDGRWEPPPEE